MTWSSTVTVDQKKDLSVSHHTLKAPFQIKVFNLSPCTNIISKVLLIKLKIIKVISWKNNNICDCVNVSVINEEVGIMFLHTQKSVYSN